jgi:hypothetical protein
MVSNSSFIDPKDLIEGDFFELAGLQNLSEQQKEELMARIIDSIQNRVALRIDDLLEDKDREAFHEVLQKEDSEAINKFLAERNIDVAKLVVEESLLQKNELLQMINAVKQGGENA